MTNKKTKQDILNAIQSNMVDVWRMHKESSEVSAVKKEHYNDSWYCLFTELSDDDVALEDITQDDVLLVSDVLRQCRKPLKEPEREIPRDMRSIDDFKFYTEREENNEHRNNTFDDFKF